MKASLPDAVPIAGGTDLLVDLNFGRLRPEVILDLTKVRELSQIDSGDVVHIGALATFSRIIQVGTWPAMVEAARTVGSPQIRNRATIGGNLGTASPAGDSLPVLVAYDADVLIGADGAAPRTVPVRDFLVGPRRHLLEEHELILGVRWSRIEGPSVFSKIGTRNAMVIAVANLCLAIDNARKRSRIALGSVGPTVLRAHAAEALLDEALEGHSIWSGPADRIEDDVVSVIAEAVGNEVLPIDDIRGSARYRRHVCRVLTKRAINWALNGASPRRAASS